MNTRLIINLTEGILEVEGSEEFVRSIYHDFREQVSVTAANKLTPLNTVQQIEPPIKEVDAPTQRKSRRPISSATKPRAASGTKPKAAEYKPLFNTSLNLAELPGFYAAFNPTSHNEKILCFAVFLRDRLTMSPCTANDIYTCYFSLKSQTKMPEAFHQAFITARNRTHFIEVEWPEKIEITIAGDNFYNEKLRRVGVADA